MLKWDGRNVAENKQTPRNFSPTTTRKQHLSALTSCRGTGGGGGEGTMAKPNPTFSPDVPRTRPSKERRLRVVSHTLNHLSLWVIPHLRCSALFACDVTPSSTARPLRRKIRKGVARETETGLCFEAVTSVWSAPGTSQSRSDVSGGWTIRRLRSCYFWGAGRGVTQQSAAKSERTHSISGGRLCVGERYTCCRGSCSWRLPGRVWWNVPRKLPPPSLHNMRQMAEVVYIIPAVAARLTCRAADSWCRRTNKHAFDKERKEIPLSHAQAIIFKKKKKVLQISREALCLQASTPPPQKNFTLAWC